MKLIKKRWLSLFLCLFVAPIYAAAGQAKVLIDSLKSKKKSGKQLSPTEALYLKYALYRSETWKQECDWKLLITEISTIEQKMDSLGYVTFVHAHRWEWNFLNDIWNLICAIRDKQKVLSHKFSLRQRDVDCDIQALYAMREDTLKNGADSWGSGLGHVGKAAEIIFMNRTFMSTALNYGECTGMYFLDNTDCSWGEKALSLAVDLLKKYNLDQYIQQVEKLFKLHKSCSDRGELLCISVKKDLVNKRVYAAYAGGSKNQKCSDTCAKVIHDAKRVNSDETFFDDGLSGAEIYCFAVSDIPGEYGRDYIIHNVHLADVAKYKTYKEKLQKLFEKIKKDFGIYG